MDKTIEKINNEIMNYHNTGKHSVKEISDGHHSFSDLYYHRLLLSKIIAESYPKYSWKSKNHFPSDEPMFNGDFILGFSTPAGQYTYHYKLKYWELFQVKELSYAPKYDGHKPEDIERLVSLLSTR